MKVSIESRPESMLHQQAFATTRWSLVARVGAEARAPLTELCLRYWYPVFRYARRCGHAPDTAQSITLAFFRFLIDVRLPSIDLERPQRFRAWLLDELAKFVATQWQGQAVAPTSGELREPLSIAELEQRNRAEGALPASPEAGFRRSFALEVVGRSVNRLRQEAAQAGRDAMFSELAPFIAADPPAGRYEAMAAAVGAPPLALVIALKRLRQRFRELADEELAETVTNADELAAERAALYGAMQGQD